MKTIFALAALVVGLSGMAGLLLASWRVWQQALEFEEVEEAMNTGAGYDEVTMHLDADFVEAPAPPPMPPPPPPPQQPPPAVVAPIQPPAGDVVARRVHADSGESTMFFTREDLLRESGGDKTQILAEGAKFPEVAREDRPQTERTRKTAFLPALPPGMRRK